MSTLTSSIYAMGPSRKTTSSKKKSVVNQKKDSNIVHMEKRVNELIESKRKLKETLDSIRDQGLLEVRVTDAVRPEWTLVPPEWTSYDFSVEEYRVIGSDQTPF